MALDPSQPNAQFGYEPDSQPKSNMTLPYDSIDIAMDGWTYRIWREWLGESDEDQRKNAYLFLDILQQSDPSATGLLEASKTQQDSPDPYSWVFRFGLFGDPANVTEAVEKIDGQLLNLAENWKVVPGSAKALVTRTDGSEEAVELPPDMVAADLATTTYRLLDLVQTGGVQAEPTTESSVSQLRQITSPDSEEYCSRHKKVGADHTESEIEDDLLNAKGEESGFLSVGEGYGRNIPDSGVKCPQCGKDRVIPYDDGSRECPECGWSSEKKEEEAETHMGVYPDMPYNQVRHPGRQEDCPICMGDERSEGALNEEATVEDLERQIEELSNEYKKPWTPGYQAVPKALKGEPNMTEPAEAPTDWGRIKKDVGTYGGEMVGLIDTLLKIGEDPTVTPEAIEKSSKVAQDRVKDIVTWASDVADKVSEEELLSGETEEVMNGIQKIIEHGNRIQMLLIGTNEEAKQTAKTPLPETEIEPELPPTEQPLQEPESF